MTEGRKNRKENFKVNAPPRVKELHFFYLPRALKIAKR